jgi:hypothetical protein
MSLLNGDLGHSYSITFIIPIDRLGWCEMDEENVKKIPQWSNVTAGAKVGYTHIEIPR